MASEDVINTADFLEGCVQRVDGGAGDAERGVDTFAAHHQDGSLDCSHFGHCDLLQTSRYFFVVAISLN
ncbi:hypothetical protein D3C84_95090 [compost metagenome]